MKAEHPGLNPHEISRICYVRFGRRPARKTVKRVLADSGPARTFSNEAEVRHLRRLQREKESELHGRRAQWVEFHSSSTTRTRPSEKHRIALDNRTYTR